METLYCIVGVIFYWVLMWYILLAPVTNFKQGFLDGLSLKFIWGRFTK